MELLTPGTGLIIWQFIVFVGLFLFLAKFAWKPILGSLQERETSIQNALDTAERAKQEMISLKADNEKLLREARVAYESAPILPNLTSLVFTAFTDGDAQARLVPALAGSLLVLTPLLLRPLIGGWWSLLAALGLAASTTLLAASRSVSPAVPAMR